MAGITFIISTCSTTYLQESPTHSIMSSKKPLLLLLGAGANIGQAVQKRFLDSGYNIVIAARSLQDNHPSPEIWSYKIDLNKPNDVSKLFSKLSKDIGIPNVIIYNGTSIFRLRHDM